MKMRRIDVPRPGILVGIAITLVIILVAAGARANLRVRYGRPHIRRPRRNGAACGAVRPLHRRTEGRDLFERVAARLPPPHGAGYQRIRRAHGSNT